jgi:hypothetical protein
LGHSDGIGIFWNNDSIKMEILPYSQYHLDAVVTEEGMDPWRLTVVYGDAQISECRKTWDMLKYIRSSNDLPGCVSATSMKFLAARSMKV